MNKFITKVAIASVGVAVAIGVGVAAFGGVKSNSFSAAYDLLAATFTCGDDGAASHADGSSASAYTETKGDYTLSIADGTKFYTGARDAKGNGCFKFGTSSVVGSMSITVPSAVGLVKIYVAGYKGNSAKISINSGDTQTVSKLSNNGEYEAYTVDTSSNKAITFTTVSGGVRAMINTIEFYIDGGSTGKEDTSVSITTAKPLALDVSDDPVHLAVTTDPSDLEVTYTSSNEEVATVSNTGYVTPTGLGSATITVAFAGDDDYNPSSDTITVNVTEPEPAHVSGKTIAEIASEVSSSVPSLIYEVTGYVTAWYGSNTDGTKYGNFYIADEKGDTTNQKYVYGANYENGCVWNGTQYTFSNNQTFLTNEVTSTITIGSRITAEFTAFMYNGTTFEFQGEIKSVVNNVQLSSIAVSDVTDLYEVGDEFIKPTVIATFDDTSTSDVTEDAIFSGYDMSNEGEYTVTVSYTFNGVTKTCDYVINIYEEIVQYTVSFDAGDGDGVMADVLVTQGTNYELPACIFEAPEGKVFGGWQYNDEIVTSVLVNSNITVLATYVDEPTDVDAVMTAGTNGSEAKVVVVNEVEKDAIKVGTSSKGGDMTITVGSGATAVKFYAAAWKGVTGLSLNISGAAVSPASVDLTADDGISSSSPFTLEGDESSFFFEISLSGVVSETAIKLESSAAKRFVVWGAVYSSSGDTPEAATLESIAVSGEKIEYHVGDDFVMPTVTATYDNAATKDVTSDAVQTGFDSSSAVAEQEITISYTENEVTVTTSYTVAIKEIVAGTYKKVETNLADFSGDYLIVCESVSKAFNGSLTKLDVANNNVDVTISDKIISASEENEFTIASKEGGYSVRSNSGYYIGKTADSNGIDTKETDDYTNTISYVGSESIDMDLVASVGTHFRYNKSSTAQWFRFFKSSTYTGQEAISLYIQVENDAEALALDILNLTNDVCQAESRTSSDFATAWETLSAKFDALVDKSPLITGDADANGTFVAEALARYDILVAKYGLVNFIGRTPIASANGGISFNDANNNISLMVVIAITSFSVIGFTTLLIIKRRKHN